MHAFIHSCYVYRDDLARYIFNRGLYLVLLLKRGRRKMEASALV
ncbi:hypothetical protein HanXRQr2_Chr12g0543771 [Helianthus annuus]|uniref:Uncharacterized protein n=1 Tax=Helianthus annuus TaxID=4232 RepID=A0A9K3HGW2_HELAN|nr:hypothetical protein HanXRQr2_Chr12g0543771 [Helianthus annuus]KAJ0862887.1 hypothetical protein HanPSC8_Chr12g0523521 [Helianthus annuus]